MGKFEFQNLKVYMKAKDFHRDCRVLLFRIKLESYVRDQLGRASLSIVLNIAEGSAKFSKPDRRNYFVIARGSLFECIAILDILNDERLINEVQFQTILNRADELSRILYAMIKNLSQKQ